MSHYLSVVLLVIEKEYPVWKIRFSFSRYILYLHLTEHMNY